MIYNQNNLKIYPIASNDETKAELTGILFQKDRTVATDSYMLIEVKNNEPLADIKDVPVIPNAPKVWANMPNKDIIIPKKAVAKALKNLNNGGKNKELPILENCWLGTPQNKEMSCILSTDLELGNITTAMNIDGKFPNYQNIIPQDNDLNANYCKVNIDLGYLIKLANTIQAMDFENVKAVDLYVHKKNPNTAVILKTKTKQKQDITGLLMPIKE